MIVEHVQCACRIKRVLVSLCAQRVEQDFDLIQTRVGYYASDNFLVVLRANPYYLQTGLIGTCECAQGVFYFCPHGKHRTGKNMELPIAQANFTCAYVGAHALSVNMRAFDNRFVILFFPVLFGFRWRYL